MSEPDPTVPGAPPAGVFAPLADRLRTTMLEPGHAYLQATVDGDLHMLRLSFLVAVQIPDGLTESDMRIIEPPLPDEVWPPGFRIVGTSAGRRTRARVGAELLADDLTHVAGLIQQWARALQQPPQPPPAPPGGDQ